MRYKGLTGSRRDLTKPISYKASIAKRGLNVSNESFS